MSKKIISVVWDMIVFAAIFELGRKSDTIMDAVKEKIAKKHIESHRQNEEEMES